jgi:hypothetical protein
VVDPCEYLKRMNASRAIGSLATYREMPRSRKASRTSSKIGSEQVLPCSNRAFASEAEAIGITFEREADSPVC